MAGDVPAPVQLPCADCYLCQHVTPLVCMAHGMTHTVHVACRPLDQQRETRPLPVAARKVFSLRRAPRRLGQDGGSRNKRTRPSDGRQGSAAAVAGGAEAGAASTGAAAAAGGADWEVAVECALGPGARARRAQSRAAAAEQPYTACAAAGGADTELQMAQGVPPAPTAGAACGLGVIQHPAAPLQAAAAGAPGLPFDPAEGQEGAAVPAVPISLPRLQAGSALERMAAEASMLHSMQQHRHCLLVPELFLPALRLNGSARRGRPPGRVPPDMQKQAGEDKAGSCEVYQQEAARVRLQASLPWAASACSLTLFGLLGPQAPGRAASPLCRDGWALPGAHDGDLGADDFSRCAGQGALPDLLCRRLWLCQQHHDHLQQGAARRAEEWGPAQAERAAGSAVSSTGWATSCSCMSLGTQAECLPAACFGFAVPSTQQCML